MTQKQAAVVVAFAGRRIDAPGAPARFPPAAEPAVVDQMHDLLVRLDPAVFVSSGACGADLIGLETAGRIGIRRRVVLPFDRRQFRETSVTDRPGDWGSRYDAVLASIDDADVVELGLDGDDAYARTNGAILDHAKELAGPGRVVAVIAWNGTPRGEGDLTARFASEAAGRGFTVEQIDTNPA